MAFNYDARTSIEDRQLVDTRVLSGIDVASRQLGINVLALLARFKIRPQLINTPVGYLDYRQIIGFMDAVAEEFNCPHWGFVVGTCQKPLNFGIWGLPMKLSPDLGTALENGIKFFRYVNGMAQRELKVEGDLAIYSRRPATSISKPSYQTATLGAVQTYNTVRDWCALDWRPDRVTLIQPSPPQASLYRRYFKCPVNFDSATTALYFPASDLRLPLPHSDPELLTAVVGYLDRIALEPFPENDIVGQVEVSIKRSLGTPTCNLTSIAQLLCLHPRKIQRQLATRGLSFNHLLSKVRMDTARHIVETSNTELAKLSRLLGYNNPSAFSKAFSKVYGISPASWRKQVAAQRKKGNQA